MILKFKGKVALGDECRVADEDSDNGAIWIGETDLVAELRALDKKPVTFAFADQRYEGPMAVDLGWGYSEWTPMDADTILIGKHNLVEILKAYNGEELTVWVADEPFNTLDDSSGD